MSYINTFSLPPQMIPLKKKNDKWKENVMDSLENIGTSQIANHDKLIENYDMLKGKFIYKHYIDSEDYKDLVTQLTTEFELPSHLRHYDIIASVVNTLSGEYQKRPDVFKVWDSSETAKNNYRREKTQLLMKFVQEGVNNFILESLANEGLDPNRQDFSSQEEADQYQQLIQERTSALTPPEIQRFMDMDWMDVAEMWGTHQIAHDNQKFNRKETERIAFEDMLAADRAFKHFYIVPGGYNEELWNPVNTFYHRSPEVTNIELGDYVGRIFYLTIPEIINRYGYRMTEEQLLQLEEFRRNSYNDGTIGDRGGSQYAGADMQANSVIPFEAYPQYTLAKNNGFNKYTTSDEEILTALGGNEVNYYPTGIFKCTEAYWMSQERIGKYVYAGEDGEPKTLIVDETFDYKLIPNLKIIESSFMEFGNESQINTLTWTWVNKCWKGIKINNRSLTMSKPMYIDIRPNDYQFKGDSNIYGAKLPVCGQIFNNRNGESMSLVDLMKPDQIGHNVAKNQLYEIMQREIGRFMLMDTNFIPSNKDWGGEGNFEKLMLVAKQLGIAPLDGSANNTKGSSFAHFQQIDLDETARMTSRMNIADYFKQSALAQVGITPQRLGNIQASETKYGVEQAQSQSYAQTESYFSRFNDFKKRYLQMSLDIAQYVQSQEEDILIMNLKSDMSRAFIRLNGSQITNAQLGLYVVDSQEVVRQLETLRQLFINNNTSGATPGDLATVVLSNSPNEIKRQLETSYRKIQEQQQAQQQAELQAQQQQLQVQQQIEQNRILKEDERLDKTLANQRYIAELNAESKGDIVDDTVDNSLDINKFNAEIGVKTQDQNIRQQELANKQYETAYNQVVEQQKFSLESKKLSQDRELKEKELKLREKEMQNNLKIAKYRDKGTANSPKK